MRFTAFALTPLIALVSCASPQSHQRTVSVSPDAPIDRPVAVHSEKAAADLQTLIAPYVAKARESYPTAKRRFLAGLPAGESFFVTAVINDDGGRTEQVFIAVNEISSGKITGLIWSDIFLVRGWQAGDSYTMAEADILDWLITKPDGSEEGNFVGNSMDTLPQNFY
jgi:uncharacterized protein YegJ (DUF2314 family)